MEPSTYQSIIKARGGRENRVLTREWERTEC